MADSDAEAEPSSAIPSAGNYNAAATSLLYLVSICNKRTVLEVYNAGADTLEENISDTLDENGMCATPAGDNIHYKCTLCIYYTF